MWNGDNAFYGGSFIPKEDTVMGKFLADKALNPESNSLKSAIERGFNPESDIDVTGKSEKLPTRKADLSQAGIDKVERDRLALQQLLNSDDDAVANGGQNSKPALNFDLSGLKKLAEEYGEKQKPEDAAAANTTELSISEKDLKTWLKSVEKSKVGTDVQNRTSDILGKNSIAYQQAEKKVKEYQQAKEALSYSERTFNEFKNNPNLKEQVGNALDKAKKRLENAEKALIDAGAVSPQNPTDNAVANGGQNSKPALPAEYYSRNELGGSGVFYSQAEIDKLSPEDKVKFEDLKKRYFTEKGKSSSSSTSASEWANNSKRSNERIESIRDNAFDKSQSAAEKIEELLRPGVKQAELQKKETNDKIKSLKGQIDFIKTVNRKQAASTRDNEVKRKISELENELNELLK